MPTISYFYISEDGSCTTFLGVGSYSNRIAYEGKITAFCTAMGWSPKNIKRVSGYLNSINELPIL